jgi:hypothetical protein
MALKLVPRFEGPQSDGDRASYREAAGQLADPTLPTATRHAAGLVVVRHMRERQNQFVVAIAAPPIGTVEDGFEFRGGDPTDPRNWRRQ